MEGGFKGPFAKIRILGSMLEEGLVPGKAICGAGGKDRRESHGEGGIMGLVIAIGIWLLDSEGSSQDKS